jgi:uroporphyrinogen decarboxylase
MMKGKTVLKCMWRSFMGQGSEPVAHSMAKILRSLSKGHLPPPGLVPKPLLDGTASVTSFRGRFSPLTNIERMITTLCHKEPDRVPCSSLTFAANRRLIGATFPEFAQDPHIAAEAHLAGFNLIGGEVIISILDLSVEAADFGQEMVYPVDSTPHPNYANPLIKDHTGYRKLKRIELKDGKRMQNVIEMCGIMVDRAGFHGVVSGFCFGPLGVLCMMRGAENLFRDCINYPTEVKAALETITEVLIPFVEAQCDAGVQAMTLDTLFASWNGLSRQLWEEIEGPFARELARAANRKGCVVGVHNCGEGVYFDSQIKFMEPEIMSFAHLPDDCADNRELKRRYGDQVVLMGFVDTTLLARGTPHEVMEECRRLIDDLADGGGFILTPGCEYPPNIPLENAFAIVKAAELYG